MLEVPENRSAIVEVKVTVFDEDFTSGVVEYTIIDFNNTVTINEESTVEDDGFAVSTTLVAAGVLGLIIMILLLLIILRTMRIEPIDTSETIGEVESDVDVVEQELGVDLSPTGLLIQNQPEQVITEGCCRVFSVGSIPVLSEEYLMLEST